MVHGQAQSGSARVRERVRSTGPAVFRSAEARQARTEIGRARRVRGRRVQAPSVLASAVRARVVQVRAGPAKAVSVRVGPDKVGRARRALSAAKAAVWGGHSPPAAESHARAGLGRAASQTSKASLRAPIAAANPEERGAARGASQTLAAVVLSRPHFSRWFRGADLILPPTARERRWMGHPGESRNRGFRSIPPLPQEKPARMGAPRQLS